MKGSKQWQLLKWLGLACCLGTVSGGSLNAAENITPDGPLRVRNLSPVVQLYGLPRAIGAQVIKQGIEASFNIEAANNFQSELRDGSFAFFDGESYVTSYRLRGALADNWEWGVEVPLVTHNDGSLDGLVDEFHELFGLPDGGRDLAPRGRLDYFIGANGQTYADIDETESDLGDVRGFVGYQWFQDERHALALRGQIKLPTGDVDDLSGSEGVDVSAWAEYQRRLQLGGRTIIVSMAAGLTYLEDGELIPEDQENLVGIGHFGLQFPVGRRLAFHAQLDGHTDVLDTGNPLLARGGILGTLGGRIAVTRKFWVDVAVIEDLANDSASDVVFQVLLGTRL